MKFGKVLKTTSENVPEEMHDLFLRYKELKKMIKAIPIRDSAQELQGSVSASGSGGSSGGSASGLAFGTTLSPEEQQFINTLNEDLARFNRYFIEKEEDAVIRLQSLSDQLEACSRAADAEADALAAKATAPDDTGVDASGSGRHHQHHHHQHRLANEALQIAKSNLVQFHGEMVLLLHWSLLNYAAVVKILKKHDKRTGVLLRAPYLANVLQQPFSSTTIMSRLAKRAEELVVQTSRAEQQDPAAAAALSAWNAMSAAAHAAQPSGTAPTAAAPADTTRSDVSSLTDALQPQSEQQPASSGQKEQEPLVGCTMHALETWANLQRNAITPSTVLAAPADDAARTGVKRKASETPALSEEALEAAAKQHKPDDDSAVGQ